MQQDKMQDVEASRKICFVIPKWSTFFEGTGGAELQCFYLSEELIKRGWQVEVVTRKPEQSRIANKEFYNSEIQFHFYVRTKSSLLNFIQVFNSLLRTKSRYYYLRTDARLLRGTSGIYCRIFRKMKIFALANDSDLVSVPLYTKFIKNRKTPFGLMRYTDAWLVEKLISGHIFNAKYYITQTLYQKELLWQKYNLNSTVIRNSFVYRNGCDVPKENIILWVANIRPQKRPEILRDVLNDLALPGWKVRMIGRYTGYEDVIRGITNPNFEALGVLPFHEVLKWLGKSRILINTSSFEGFPNTFIQAWFYKCLVISYEFDPDGLLSEKSLGFAAKGDFTRFKELIRECTEIGNFESRVDKAAEFAKSEFNIEQNVQKFISLLTEN